VKGLFRKISDNTPKGGKNGVDRYFTIEFPGLLV
jgi:hypothetical protein